MKEDENCWFSHGICGKLTCSQDGFFDENGYPMYQCEKYPCEGYKKLNSNKVDE